MGDGRREEAQKKLIVYQKIVFFGKKEGTKKLILLYQKKAGNFIKKVYDIGNISFFRFYRIII
jgi:hypothetical protein